MSKVAFVFPGQGAQYIGMGKDFYENSKEANQVFAKASKISGLDMAKLCFEENKELNITEYTQIAMFTVCCAILIEIQKRGYKPDVSAGLSLGEYAALVASGVIDFSEGCKIVKARGKLMQEAVPTGGAMAAVLGLDTSKIEEICDNTQGIVQIANYNCPGQIVISGEDKAIELAEVECMKAGAKRVIKLNVSGPFHSNMLKDAGDKLRTVLEEVSFKDITIPYVSNVTGEYVTDKNQVIDLLEKQVYSSVKWQQSVENMICNGVDTFVEIGPGKTLSSFIKKIDKTAKIISIEKIEDMEKLSQI